jgi:hypothetical protein
VFYALKAREYIEFCRVLVIQACSAMGPDMRLARCALAMMVSWEDEWAHTQDDKYELVIPYI